MSLALRLSPRAPDWVVYKLAEAYLVQGDADAAARVTAGLLARPPSSPSNKNLTLIIRALALDALNRTNEAEHAVATAVEVFPRRTLAVWTGQRPYADKAVQEAWSTRLRELGMP